MAQVTFEATSALNLSDRVEFLFTNPEYSVTSVARFRYIDPSLNVDTGNTQIGLIANYIDADNYYYCMYDFLSQRFSLVRKTAGSDTLLESDDLVLSPNYPRFTTYELKLDINNTEVSSQASIQALVDTDINYEPPKSDLVDTVAVRDFVRRSHVNNYTINTGSVVTNVTVDVTALIGNTQGGASVDVYAKVDEIASALDFDASSTNAGDLDEQIIISVPAFSTLHIAVVGAEGTAYTIEATLTDDTGYTGPVAPTAQSGVLSTLSNTAGITLTGGGQAGYFVVRDWGAL